MIDLMKSAELNSMKPIDLYVWLKNYPKSHKRIITYCEECGEEREITYSAYTDLCLQCANSNLEKCNKHSKNRSEYWSYQENRDAAAERTTKYFGNHPEARISTGEKLKEYYSHKENRINDSERIKNSEAHKIAVEIMRGGNDIVKHHYIYDESDSSKYTTEMTRSTHTKIHRAMQKEGITIPHINIKV